MNDLNVLKTPTSDWLDRLRQGNWVWLVKEEEFAVIEWEWEPPQPGYITGRICIMRYQNDTFTTQQTWFISNNGCGIDGSLLFLPVEGHLSDAPPDIPIPEVRKIHRELDRLKRRVSVLDAKKVYKIITKSYGARQRYQTIH